MLKALGLKMSLWPRMALAISLGFITLFLAFSFLAERALQESTDRILDERQVIAQMAASQIDGLLEQTIAELERAGQFSKLDPEALQVAAEAELLAYQKVQDENLASGMIFLNTHGDTILLHPPQFYPPAIDLLAWTFIKDAINRQKVMISEPYFEPISGGHLAAIAVPIFIGSRYSGLIIGVVDLQCPDILSTLQQASTLGISGHASLVTSSGLSIASTYADIPFLSPGEHQTFYRKALASQTTIVDVAQIELDLPDETIGERHVMAFVPLRLAPWGVAVGGDEEETFAGVRRLRSGMVILGSITLVALWAATLVGTRMLLKPVRVLTQAAEKIAAGHLSTPLHIAHEGEIGIMATALEHMRTQLLANIQELTNWNETLEQRVNEKTEDLRQQGAFIRSLLRRAMTAQEEERARIARELHDEIGQTLTAVDLGMERLSHAIQSDQVDVQEKLIQVRVLTQKGVTDLRRIIAAMRPGILDELGLVPALGWMSNYALGPLGVNVDLQVDVSERLPDEIETTLFRIAQEAMSNVARHSQAKNLLIHLERLNGEVIMTLVDDGRGLDQARTPSADVFGQGLGIASMKERASLLGGQVSIASVPGHGTKLRISLPLKDGT